MRMFLLMITLGVTSGLMADELEFYESSRPNMPFSEAVKADDLLFLSGRLGTKNGKLVAGGIKAETQAAMESIQSSLESHGLSMNQVAKCTVFLKDMGDFGAMNGIYTSFFPGPKPARSAVEVSGLALGASVEIECIALDDD